MYLIFVYLPVAPAWKASNCNTNDAHQDSPDMTSLPRPGTPCSEPRRRRQNWKILWEKIQTIRVHIIGFITCWKSKYKGNDRNGTGGQYNAVSALSNYNK